MKGTSFSVGTWLVEPELGRLRRNGDTVELQPVTMQLLCFMAEHAGEVLSHDELLDGVWGKTVVSDNVIYWNINQLRKVLGSGDETEQYIQTLPKRGYRLVATVDLDGTGAETSTVSTRGRKGRHIFWVAALTIGFLVFAWQSVYRSQNGNEPNHAEMLTLAVLPFVNMSEGEEDESFADGFTEELLNFMSQLPDLRVIARTSSFYYKDRNIDLREVGKTLGAASIIEGSVRRSDDRVRITVQLIDAQSGHHRWSQTYDRRLIDALDVQKDVAEQVARALEIELSPTDVAQLAEDSDVHAEAVALYRQAQARSSERRRGPEIVEEMRALLDRSLEIEPGFLPALYLQGFNYAMLRSIYGLSFEKSVAPARAVLEQMREQGHENTGEFQLLLAIVSRLEMSAWGVTPERIEAVNSAYERAINTRPNDPLPLLSYAIHVRRIGDFEKAGELLQQAALLDPLDVGVNLQLARLMGNTGQFDEAMNIARALTVHYPDNPSSFATVAEVLAVHGKFAEAIQWLDQYPVTDGDVRLMLLYRMSHFAMGDQDGAIEWMYRAPITSVEEGLVLGIRQSWQDAFVELDRLVRNNPSLERSEKEAAGNAAFLAGQFEAARFFLESAAPDLVNQESLILHQQNFRYAIKLAATLQALGEYNRADVLLNRLDAWLVNRPRLGWEGYMTSRAELLVMQGRHDEALKELRTLFDQGWKQLYGTYIDCWYGQISPILARLDGHPEFEALKIESEHDLSLMRRKVR